MNNKKRKEAGFGLLLELILVMGITTILLAQSAVSFVRIRATQNQVIAQQRLRLVAEAQAQVAICAATSGCIPSVGLVSIIPADGSAIPQAGYTYTYHLNGGYWTFAAAPIQPGTSGQQTYWIDYSGILRCAPNDSPAAGATSPAC